MADKKFEAQSQCQLAIKLWFILDFLYDKQRLIIPLGKSEQRGKSVRNNWQQLECCFVRL